MYAHDNRVRRDRIDRAGIDHSRYPGPDELGLRDCPRPPFDPDGKGGWVRAYGCKCFLVPLVSD